MVLEYLYLPKDIRKIFIEGDKIKERKRNLFPAVVYICSKLDEIGEFGVDYYKFCKGARKAFEYLGVEKKAVEAYLESMRPKSKLLFD